MFHNAKYHNNRQKNECAMVSQSFYQDVDDTDNDYDDDAKK